MKSTMAVVITLVAQHPQDPEIEKKMQEFREELRKRSEQVERETIEDYKEQQRQRAAASKRAKAKEEERLASIRRQPSKFHAALVAREVMIGMNKEQVSLAWGKPKSVNRTITSQKVSEQWVFGLKTYVYLDDGLVVAIQN